MNWIDIMGLLCAVLGLSYAKNTVFKIFFAPLIGGWIGAMIIGISSNINAGEKTSESITLLALGFIFMFSIISLSYVMLRTENDKEKMEH